jgi:ATP-binding cassette, subfamily B, bacterial
MKIESQTWKSFLWFFIKKHGKGFAMIQIFCFGMTMDSTLWPQVIRMAVGVLDNYHGPKGDLWYAISHVILFGLIVWIGIEVSFRLSGILAAKIMPKFEADVRMAMFEYVSEQTHSFFANNFSGSLANKINDMPRASHAILSMLMTLFIPALLSFMIVTLMFVMISPLFGSLIFLWLFIHLGISFNMARKCQDYSDIHANSRSKLIGRIVDCFTNNVSMRIFARRKYEIQYIGGFQEEERNNHQESLMYMEKVKIYLGSFSFLFMGVFMTWLQIYSYKNNIITLADLVYVFNAISLVMATAWWVGLELPRLFQEIGVCKQALTLIQKPIQIVDKENAVPIKISKGKIVFDKVTFNYERNNNIFEEQSIVINPGEKIGLIGFSGSGKTTFVNLIMRYFDIQSGKILIDDQNICDVKQESLREQIAMIPQEPTLYHRSLMENIRYGNLNATDEEVIEAAKKAHCHEFITKMKKYYESIVGERGLKLSGGQRQRIAIARAILKRAPILIMDEATSALDSVTEKYIQESIEEISKDRTTLIIAHRLSTLADMNRILVFKDGSITEDGTHEELLALDGHYNHLWHMQIDGFLPEIEYGEEVGEEEEG